MAESRELLKDLCFPDSDGAHPDELENGKITYFIVKYNGRVLNPEEQAQLIAVHGLKQHRGSRLTNFDRPTPDWFSWLRSADSVPPDLYKIWYDFFRGMIGWRREKLADFGFRLAAAESDMDRARRTYILPGDDQFEPAHE